MSNPNPYHQESLAIDPDKQIHDFRQAIRHNQNQDAIDPLMKFIRHYQVSGMFHQFTQIAIRTWLSNDHGIKGDVLAGVDIVVRKWWSGGIYYVSGNNSYDCVTYAMFAGILTVKKDSQIYPGPEFPVPDQSLAKYLTQARKQYAKNHGYDNTWTPTAPKKDPADWNGGYPP